MTDLEKLLAEATPEQLASALIEARKALDESADELDEYYSAEYGTDHPYHVNKLAQAKAANPARAALAHIDAIMGERDD